MRLRLLLYAFALSLPAGVLANFQDPQTIRQAAIAAVAGSGAQVEATVDTALRMPACTTPLQAMPVSAISVEVGCEGSWRLFVPVRVQRVVPVLVLALPLAPGEVLAPEHLRVEQRDAARLNGAPLSNPAEAIGQALRRGGRAGMALTRNDLASTTLVRRGDRVTLLASAGGVEVRMAGKALGNAAAGQRLNVENLSSRRVVQGLLTPNGDVQVGL